jgi:hypothetical protein
MKLVAFMVALSAALAACAARPYPAARVGSAEAAVRSADRAGAQGFPDAAMHVRRANDAIAQARELMDAGEYDRAESLLRRAEADAHVATLLAEQAAERSAERTKASP